MKNLKLAIEKLNAPTKYEDEKLESPFDFKLVEENGSIKIYDSNEAYYIDWQGYAYLWL